jgi:membrane-associated phospholipid phosphatase
MPATVVTETLERRLVARRLYPVVVGIILAAGAIAAGLGVDYTEGSWAERIDRAVDGPVVARYGDRGHQRLVHGLAYLGSTAPILLATSALVIAMLALGRLRAAVFAVLGPSFAILITDAVLKPWVDRIQPGQAYPSGHATAFCAVAFVVVVLALDQRPRRLPRSVQVIVCGGALMLVGCVIVGLVAAQYHVATDTIGGLCVALVTVLTLALVIDGIADRRVKHRLDNRTDESHHAVG